MSDSWQPAGCHTSWPLQLAAAAYLALAAGSQTCLGSKPGQLPQDRSPQDSAGADRRSHDDPEPPGGPPMAWELLVLTLGCTDLAPPFTLQRAAAVRSPTPLAGDDWWLGSAFLIPAATEDSVLAVRD